MKNLTGEFNTLGYSEKEYNTIRVYFNTIVFVIVIFTSLNYVVAKYISFDLFNDAI